MKLHPGDALVAGQKGGAFHLGQRTVDVKPPAAN
jgi:hypothetical protein